MAGDNRPSYLYILNTAVGAARAALQAARACHPNWWQANVSLQRCNMRLLWASTQPFHGWHQAQHPPATSVQQGHVKHYFHHRNVLPSDRNFVKEKAVPCVAIKVALQRFPCIGSQQCCLLDHFIWFASWEGMWKLWNNFLSSKKGSFI